MQISLSSSSLIHPIFDKLTPSRFVPPLFILMSYFPSFVGEKDMEGELVDLIHNEIVGNGYEGSGTGSWLENMMRAGRSTGPKEVLLKLAINRHLLQMQLAAVQIQASYRRYAAQLRVNIIRRRLIVFLSISKQIAQRIMEEMILTLALELSMDIVESRDQLSMMKTLIGKSMVVIAEEMFDQQVLRMTLEVVKETIAEATDKFLNIARPKKVVEITINNTTNPLIQVLLTTCNEVSDSYIRSAVIESILEEVKEYLYASYSKSIFDHIYHEEILNIITEACEYESIVDYELQPVLLPLIEDVKKELKASTDQYVRKPSQLKSDRDTGQYIEGKGEVLDVNEVSAMSSDIVNEYIATGVNSVLRTLLTQR